MAEIGERLRESRRAKRITIVELAAKIGVSQAYLVRVERGEIKPTNEQIETIMNFLAAT